MAFLKDVHHGNLEVLKGLRPAAASQTPTGGRIKDSHHGPEPWRGGPITFVGVDLSVLS